jgi:CHASE1-domain containing sensor protein
MWTYLFSFLLLRRLRLATPIWYALAVFLIGLILAVLIYTAILFFNLEERTNPNHVYARINCQNFPDACAIASR